MRIPISSSDISRGTISRIAKSLRPLWPEQLGHMQARTKLAVALGYRDAHDLEQFAKQHQSLSEQQLVDVQTVRDVFASALQKSDQLPLISAKSIAIELPFELLDTCKGVIDIEPEAAPLSEPAARLGFLLLEHWVKLKTRTCTIALKYINRKLGFELTSQTLSGLLAELFQLRTLHPESGEILSRIVSTYALIDEGKTLTYQLCSEAPRALDELYLAKRWEGPGLGANSLFNDLAKLPPPSKDEIAWGRKEPDMYYFRRELLSRGFDVPFPLSFDEALPLLIQAGIDTGNHIKIDLKRQNIIWRDLEDDGEELPEADIVAGDDYVGTVSFRAEAMEDYLQLKQLLQKRYSKVIAYEIEDEAGIQLVIAKPLTIRKLYNQMLKVIDGRYMYDTLRALPLNQNCLERRMEEPEYPPEDWATNGED